MTCYALYWRTE